jgi:glycosyltransferase involved in cell wall biosynthesis
VIRWLLPVLATHGRAIDLVAVGTAVRADWMLGVPSLRVATLGCDSWTAALHALRNYFRCAQPATCVSVHPMLSVLALAAADARTGARPRIYAWEPTITSLTGKLLPEPLRCNLHRLQRELYPQASGILAVSTDCLDDLESMGISAPRRAVVPNCLDQVEIYRGAHACRELHLPHGGLPIVAAGRLSPEKGYGVLLRALAVVCRRRPDVWLALVGDGVERARLQSLSRELGIADRVWFVGSSTHPWPWFGIGSVFVHPALWEGFGMSLLEAMALGLPVIATSCPGGPKELLEGGRSGLLVPPGDEIALACAIERVLQDPILRADLRARARTRADAYSPEKVASILEAAIA